MSKFSFTPALPAGTGDLCAAAGPMSKATYYWHEPRPSRARKPIPKAARDHFVAQMVIHDSAEDQGQFSTCVDRRAKAT